jgi:hypothetical protein
MATVMDKVIQPGEHVVRFDAKQLTPGIYIYRKSTADNRQPTIGKLVVVR